MEELALHVLDIAENSVAAGARHVSIRITDSRERDRLVIEIRDDGRGMDRETLRRAQDPFYTTRTTRRVGLGLPLLSQAARSAGGRLRVASRPGKGTAVRASFRHSHPDRQPLGGLPSTLLALVAGYPEVDFECVYRSDHGEASLQTCTLREQLGDRPFSSPEGIALVRQRLAAFQPRHTADATEEAVWTLSALKTSSHSTVLRRTP